MLSNLNMHGFSVLIFSDCNINILKLNTSQLASEYLDVCHSNGYLTNFKSSRINQHSYSLIDHIMSNNTSANVISGTIVHELSDHLPVFYSCNDVQFKKRDVTSLSRDMSNNNISKFKEALRWNNVLSEQNVNSALNNFLDPFLTLFELHFPLTKRKVNRNYNRVNEFMTAGWYLVEEKTFYSKNNYLIPVT
jgi:hypothetical protein